MKIESNKEVSPFNELTKLQKCCMFVAVAMAFAAVFVWFFKIIFF